MQFFEDLELVHQKQSQGFKTKPIISSMGQSIEYRQSQGRQSTNQTNNNAFKLNQSQLSRLNLSNWRQKQKKSINSQKNFSQNEMKNYNNTTNANSSDFKMRKFTQKDIFQCKICVENVGNQCDYCKGKKQLNGTDKIIKFFEYILQFKLGKVEAYNNEKKSLKRNAPNQHCKAYFSSIFGNQTDLTASVDQRMSVSINTNRFFASSQYQKDSCLPEIHHGFECDECETDPIFGTRYHCQQCKDYDLCKECYVRKGHYHEMNKAELKKNQKTQEKINNLLKGGNNLLKSSNPKNGLPIRNSFNSKIYKSSIR